jgi:hypothetical protein
MGERMKQIRQEGDKFSLDVREVGDEIRPPMNTIPAYLARRKELSR